MANLALLSSRHEVARHGPAIDADWDGVSEHRPCPVCGAESECSRHVGDAFVSCARRPSDWPLTNGGWLHRLTFSAEEELLDTRGPADDCT
jgi:hypothetical protein